MSKIPERVMHVKQGSTVAVFLGLGTHSKSKHSRVFKVLYCSCECYSFSDDEKSF